MNMKITIIETSVGGIRNIKREGIHMFFIGLTVSLILLFSGIALLVESSYLIGAILLGSGIILLIIMVWYYRNRNRKKEKESWDCLDCNFVGVDCSHFPSK